MAGRGGNCRKKGGLVAGQGRAPNRVPAGLQAVAPLRKVIFFVQPGAVVKKIPIFAAQLQSVPRFWCNGVPGGPELSNTF